MKIFKFHAPDINPIYRDLALVILMGLFASLAIVVMGYTIYAQLK